MEKLYDFKEIEKKWQESWRASRIYEPNLDKPRKPFYNLMMFPYPSAEGLHVGNVYAFTGSDAYGRYQRMRGNDVFEPIGLDGFGIHSENYALKIGAHPIEQAERTEENFYRQLRAIGNGFAWDARVETYDPEYYRWTQWLFLQLFKRGLAERKKAAVNWCPSCKTVLADEQAEGGECERCGTQVVKKELEQWFFKITDYADRLLDGLQGIDWSERVKIAQRNWIGKSEGALLEFPTGQFSIKVFTTRPDTILGATYIVLAPEHPLIENQELRIKNQGEIKNYVEAAKRKTEQERLVEGKVKTGVELKGITAINPATGTEIPIWVADYVLAGYGTGAIMAVPAHDERDRAFAETFDLPISDAELLPAREVLRKTHGRRETHYHLRDWLISRQRYWGPPIPIVYCDACGTVPVPEKDLPIKLPYIKDFRPTGTNESPLAADASFYKTTCPRCGHEARRETDVSDTFLDSAWYFLRYPDAHNGAEPFSKKRMKKWLPVNMYIGGAEHSVLHLLYARFITKVLHDAGHLRFDEPFTKFRAHGLIIKDGAKMSKSKGNVINPDEYVALYGADALRLYLMFLAPLEDGGDFRDSGMRGMAKFLNRVWQMFSRDAVSGSETEKLVHQAVKKVSEDIEALKFNTAISQLMILLNAFEKNGSTRESRETFLKLLAPFAPHITEELWHMALRNEASIHTSAWPIYDARLAAGETVEIGVQVDGKLRATVTLAPNAPENDARAAALADERVRKYVPDPSADGRIARVIYVPGRIINVITKTQ